MKIQPDSKLGHLIIIRGIAGSGKSTMAQVFLDKIEAEHFEADMFFINDNDEYIFEPSQISDAHDWCKRETRKALMQGKNVIVSNTFITLWEMKPYLDMKCASLAIYEAKGDYGSIHDVPDKVINRMKRKWETLPNGYNDYKKN